MEKLEQLESKYYTPSIEEFHVGFEYEAFLQQVKVLEEPHQEGDNWVYPVENIGYNWVPQVYEQGDFGTIDWENEEVSFREIYPSEVRVKYLDKEDVESILKELKFEIGDEYCTGGWTKEHLDYKEWYIEAFNDKTSHDIFISKNKTDGLISIEDDETFLFTGNIKNKSELKVLLKQLGIDE